MKSLIQITKNVSTVSGFVCTTEDCFNGFVEDVDDDFSIDDDENGTWTSFFSFNDVQNGDVVKDLTTKFGAPTKIIDRSDGVKVFNWKIGKCTIVLGSDNEGYVFQSYSKR